MYKNRQYSALSVITNRRTIGDKPIGWSFQKSVYRHFAVLKSQVIRSSRITDPDERNVVNIVVVIIAMSLNRELEFAFSGR